MNPQSPKYDRLSNHRKTFTTSPVRVLVYPDQENVETNQNAAKAVVGIEENKIPLTLSQKVMDYSSIHFATPSFRFYPKFQNEIINVKQKPPKLQSHTPSSQQAIGNILDQHLQNASNTKK